MSISAAFVKAQRNFGPALKTRTHPHLQAAYADLGTVIEAVVDALHNEGIALTQITHEQQGGVCVETVFIHESGERLSFGKLFLPAMKQDAQGYGSALTYARRYSLLAACGIAPSDDDGYKAQTTKAKPAIARARLDKAIQSIKDGTYTTDKLRAAFSLTAEQDAYLVKELAK